MSASRNLGIEHAKGEYIAFLDADDVWLPYKLQEQVTIIDQYPSVALLYGHTLYWHSWTGKSENEQQDLVPPLSIQTNVPISPPTLLPLYLRGKAAVPCTCSILVRRSSLNRVDGFEESFRGLYEDQAFYVKICLEFPVMAVDTCWDKYRQHPASSVAIAGQLTERTTARQFFLKWVAAYLVKQQINDNNIWQALRKELWLSSQPVWLLNLPKGSYILRWIKKWIIKLEETILPAKEW
jgi:glycosyltransferase involved in cell wall biosynthesis